MPAHVGFVPYSTAADSHNFKPVFYDNHRHVEPSLGREAGPWGNGGGGARRPGPRPAEHVCHVITRTGPRATAYSLLVHAEASLALSGPERTPGASLSTRQRLSLTGATVTA